MNISVDVDVQTLAFALRSLDYSDILAFVKELDLMVADCGFTEELIKILVHSLKPDKEDVDLPFIDWSKV